MRSVALASIESFADRVTELLERVDYRRAESSEDREAIFRHRYDEYLRDGALAPALSQRLTDSFDDDAWVFGIYIDGTLAASIRINVVSGRRGQLPAMKVFSDVLLREIEAGKTIVDPTRIVTDHGASREHPGLIYVTARVGWMAGEFFKADLIVAGSRVEHAAFYKRVFNFRSVSEPRFYPLLKKPCRLMMLDYAAVRDQVHRRYPFLRSTFFERRMLFERPAQIAQRVAA